jgi:hypothetical protein
MSHLHVLKQINARAIVLASSVRSDTHRISPTDGDRLIATALVMVTDDDGDDDGDGDDG